MTMMHVMCFISKHLVESDVRSACLDNGEVEWLGLLLRLPASPVALF